MENSDLSLTAPSICHDSSILFSAYGFGWGYCAFSLPASVVCAQLGAANETPRQLLLAFELGKHRILLAARRFGTSSTGERIVLDAVDLG